MKESRSSIRYSSGLLRHSDYAEDFFDDMLMIFMGQGRGEASKYMYDNVDLPQDTNLWEEIVKSSADYYVPRADSELLQRARPDLRQHIPQGTPYIDFGIGGQESFARYVLPTMSLLKSTDYIGVDYDQKILNQAEALQPELRTIRLRTSRMDFFKPTCQSISDNPALGVMNGVTLGNMYGSLADEDLEDNLVSALENLAQLTCFGWLLLSIDTNQDEDTLMKMYQTPLNSHLNIASLPRMEAQLPVRNLDSSLFTYEPRWLPEKQLVAHLAIATEQQNFSLGEYAIDLHEGQEVHLFNSYKFRQEFFESCCPKANLQIVRSWDHPTGVMLYLLKGNNQI